jgi:hypothetical protein
MRTSVTRSPSLFANLLGLDETAFLLTVDSPTSAGALRAGDDQRTHVKRSFIREAFSVFNIGNSASQDGRVRLQDPPIARFLFQSSAAAWLWLILRLLVGYQFLTSGWGKFSGGKWLDGSGSSIPGLLAERGEHPRDRQAAHHQRLVQRLLAVHDRHQ